MVNSFTRIAMAGAAVAAVLAGTASTAQAADVGVLDTNKVLYLTDGRGKMTFIDDGDMFEVCDTRADGHGVEGQLVDDTQRVLLYVDDGGDAGCDKKGYNIGNGTQYQMQFWWSGGGSGTQYSQWFNE
ncbi:hypothetical protein ACFU98_05155 [Streptomyces sp. NPDC057575]|uniref:hypothetical protein n=1 Tax=unclassified Streptomyces TaxID=2593676 RepID=UPI0036B8F021